MGYTSADGAAGKGLGSFTDTASTQADLDKLVELIARVGNRRADLSSVRTALTGSALYPGLEFHETDTGLTYLRGASSWVLVDGDTGWTLTTSQNTSVYFVETIGGDRALSVRRIGKRVRLEGHIRTNTGTGAYSIWAFIPAGYRPGKNAWLAGLPDGTGTSVLRGFVTPAGELTFASGSGGATSVFISTEWFIE